MAVDMRLAQRGRNIPLQGLVQQARVSLALASQYEAALAAVGFTPEERAEGLKLLAELDSQAASSAEAHDQGKLATQTERTALAEAKAFKRKLDLKLRRYFRLPGAKPVTTDAFEAGGTLGRSTPKVSQYFANIRAKLALIDAALKPYFQGQSALALLDGVKAKLDGSQTTQELGKLNLPEQTLKVYEQKGRLDELLAELRDAGRDAFDGQAEIAAKFNKDLLLAAVRSRPDDEEPPLAPTG